jgi:hypothetical protein
MNYQPLFNKLADLGYIETESEMQEIINACNEVTGVTQLLTTTRKFLIAHVRYMASANQGRLKEVKAAEKLLEFELAKWPAEKERIIHNSNGLF